MPDGVLLRIEMSSGKYSKFSECVKSMKERGFERETIKNAETCEKKMMLSPMHLSYLDQDTDDKTSDFRRSPGSVGSGEDRRRGMPRTRSTAWAES